MNALTWILVLIIMIEIFYLLVTDSELWKEHIDTVLTSKGSHFVKLVTTVIVMSFGVVLVASATFLERKYKLNKWVLMICVVSTLLTAISIKLYTNVTFSNNKEELNIALNQARTGDLVFSRCYHSYDIPELIFYRWLSALFSPTFLAHVGIIVKENGKTYILESTEDYHHCEYSKYNKNGVLLNLAESRIQKYEGRVYLCKTNLHEYMKPTDMFSFLDEHKHKRFFEDNLNCVGLISRLFHSCSIFNGNHIALTPGDFLNPSYYAMPFKITETRKVKTIHSD
jgi:hypothetical protein